MHHRAVEKAGKGQQHPDWFEDNKESADPEDDVQQFFSGWSSGRVGKVFSGVRLHNNVSAGPLF